MIISCRRKWRAQMHAISLFFILFALSSAKKDTTSEQLKDLDPQNKVLALDVSHGSIALGTVENIYVYEQNENNLSKSIFMGKIPLPNYVSETIGYLELKLLSRTQVLYCDENQCRLCTISHTKSSCSTLSLSLNNVTLTNLESAAVARGSGDRVFLRVVQTSKIHDHGKSYAGIFSYDIQDMGNIVADQTAQDATYIQNLHTVLGFSRKSYSYYVSSSYQPNEPLSFPNLFTENSTLLKITRVCERDETAKLESRIDLVLNCGNSKTFTQIDAAFYDESYDQLFVSAQHNNGKHTICVYDMTEVDTQIDNTWNTCQNVSLSDVSIHCQRSRSVKTLKDHCYIFTHMSDSSRPCAKFGLKNDQLYENCDLHKAKTNTYRYAWLENFKGLHGKIMGLIDSDKVSAILPDRNYGAMFVVTEKNKRRNIIRILTDMDSGEEPTDFNHVVWEVQTDCPSIRSIGSTPRGNELMFINSSRVSVLSIECNSLYSSCDALEKGGFDDNLNCIWCPDDSKRGAFPSSDKFGCSQPLTSICPPYIDHANRDGNLMEWEIFGYKLDRLKDSFVLICGEKCFVNQTHSNDLKLHCAVTTVKDVNCDVKVVGNLGNYNQFVMKSPRVTSSVLVGTNEEDPHTSKSGTKAWKAILAAIVVLLIIIALLVIIWYARKYTVGGRKRQPCDIPTSDIPLGKGAYNDPFNGNPYHNLGGLNSSEDQYLPLFNQLIPGDMIVDCADIQLEKQIGGGNFGDVYQARLTRNGSNHVVACKTLKHPDGFEKPQKTTEFLQEGLIMMKFNHPNVIKLIGMAYQNSNPVIITEYMANQDLHRWLKNDEVKVTLRQLLNFATQIADGMAHIHSRNYIHRDLAARNCMLNSDYTVKITDFGLCREVNPTNDLYSAQVTNRLLPCKWMAPEVIETSHFDKSGDVWAYGVVVWELMSRSQQPYEGKSGYEVQQFLNSGGRLFQPQYCPDLIYHGIMLKCWDKMSSNRPTFDELTLNIREIIESMENQQRQKLESDYERVSPINRNSGRTSTSTVT